MTQTGVAFTTHDSQTSWKEELIARLQDGLDKLYISPNHNLPDVEANVEVRWPESVKKIHDDDVMMMRAGQRDEGGWMMMRAPNLQHKTKEGSDVNKGQHSLLEGPGASTERTKRFRVSPNNHRHPCYVVVSISKINDVKSANAFFDLRVRLSLLFEFDLVGAGFKKLVDDACESPAGFLPLSGSHMEMLRDLGIVIPRMVFLNAISQQDVRPVETRVYPRLEKSKLDCITCSCMWDVQFRQQFDLRDFPFDSQDLVLELSITDSEAAHVFDRFHLVVYSIQYKQDLVNVPEWRVHVPRIQRRLPFHRRMNIHVRISRQPQYYLWNIIFVSFMISTLGFTVFMESWKNTSERVSVVLTLLLTNITFQYNVSSQLPKLFYFTLLDSYTFRNIFSLFLLSFGCCAAKFHTYLVYNVDSLDWLDGWSPESIDKTVSFIFGFFYVLAHIQGLFLVFRKCYRFSDDILSNSQFGESSKNAPIWLCFMFGYPFFLGAPEDGNFRPLAFGRDTTCLCPLKSPRTPENIVFPKTPSRRKDHAPSHCELPKILSGTASIPPKQFSEDITGSDPFNSLIRSSSPSQYDISTPPPSPRAQHTRPETKGDTSANSFSRVTKQTQCGMIGTNDNLSCRGRLGTRLRRDSFGTSLKCDSHPFSSQYSAGCLHSLDTLVGG